MTSLRSSNMESYLTRVMSAESELITGELPQRQLLKFQDLANWIYTRVRPMVPLYFLSKLLGLKNSNRVALSCLDGLVRSPQSKQVDKETETTLTSPNLVPKFRSYSSRRGPWKRGWNHPRKPGIAESTRRSSGIVFSSSETRTVLGEKAVTNVFQRDGPHII